MAAKGMLVAPVEIPFDIRVANLKLRESRSGFDFAVALASFLDQVRYMDSHQKAQTWELLKESFERGHLPEVMKVLPDPV